MEIVIYLDFMLIFNFWGMFFGDKLVNPFDNRIIFSVL